MSPEPKNIRRTTRKMFRGKYSQQKKNLFKTKEYNELKNFVYDCFEKIINLENRIEKLNEKR